jgi:hypothetical protein
MLPWLISYAALVNLLYLPPQFIWHTNKSKWSFSEMKERLGELLLRSNLPPRISFAFDKTQKRRYLYYRLFSCMHKMSNDKFQDIVIEMIRDLKAETNNLKAETNQQFAEMRKLREEDRAEAKSVREEDRKEAKARHQELIDLIKAEREDRIEALREERIERREMEHKLEKVYESRDKVKITFGWQWGMASLLIAICSVGIVQILRLGAIA